MWPGTTLIYVVILEFHLFLAVKREHNLKQMQFRDDVCHWHVKNVSQSSHHICIAQIKLIGWFSLITQSLHGRLSILGMSAIGRKEAHKEFEMSITFFQFLNKPELTFVLKETVKTENSQNASF